MRKKVKLILFGAGFLIFAGLMSIGIWQGWFKFQAAENEYPGQVYGMLTDPIGYPIEQATIFIGTYQGLTDTKGRFFISNIPPGLYPYSVYTDEGQKLKGPYVDITVAVSGKQPAFLNLGGFELAM